MIKLIDLDHSKAIKNAQYQVGTHKNYLEEVLIPAVERGDWDEFEKLDIGFNTSGQTLGKIGDDMAWRKLQPVLD
ncbi:site-specific integrase, partial [Vibrio sp. M260118]